MTQLAGAEPCAQLDRLQIPILLRLTRKDVPWELTSGAKQIEKSFGSAIAVMSKMEKLTISTDTLLAEAGKSAQYAERAVIFSQGATGRSIYYVQQGLVMLAIKTRGKRTAVIAVLPAGSFFNEACLLNIILHATTATTLVPSSIVAIEKDEMLQLLDGQAIISSLFRTHLVATNIRYREDLLDVLVSSVKQRLARALLRLANISSNGPRRAQIPRISQRALAEMVGTTRSRVNFFMNEFRKSGFISYNGSIDVHGSLRKALLNP
jgi:CRP/FNR family cyclic AMP-dependent transcriptional regulator